MVHALPYHEQRTQNPDLPMKRFLRLVPAVLGMIRQATCRHPIEFGEIQKDGSIVWKTQMVQAGSHLALDDWQPPEPHPHPKFAHRIKIQRQPIAVLIHCKRCGKLWINRGFNQRDVEPQRMPGSSVL